MRPQYDKMNIGCGNDVRDGYENIDIRQIDGALQTNIEHGLEYNDSLFSEIICNKVLVYINNLIFVMNEICRVGKNGCVVKIRDVYYNSQGAYSDVEQREKFTLNKFERLKELRGFEGKYEIIKNELKYTRLGKLIPFEFLRRKMSMVWGEIASEVYVELRVLK